MAISTADVLRLTHPVARIRNEAARRISEAIGAGGGGGGGPVAWADVTGKPSTFTPSAHTHAIADVTGLQDELDSKSSVTAIDGGTAASVYGGGGLLVIDGGGATG